MANREAEPTFSAQRLSIEAKIDRVNDLITLVTELKADYNALRTDFVRHDHASTYTQAAIREAAADISPSSGAYASAAITARVPTRFIPDTNEVFSEEYISAQVVDLISLISTLKTQINNLRQDVARHDHGGTYAQSTIRINGSDNTVSAGALASTTIDAGIPKKFAGRV